jgi:hypothetical protein
MAENEKNDKNPILVKIIDLVYTMLLIIMISAILGLILAFPVMWLWNYVFKNFGENMQITVLQAWALNVLIGILFNKSSNTRK